MKNILKYLFLACTAAGSQVAFAQSTVSVDSFTATVAQENRVTVTWTTTGAETVYLRPSAGYMKEGGVPELNGSHIMPLNIGTHRLTLVATNASGEVATSSLEVNIEPPKPVVVDQTAFEVDPFDPSPVTISWTKDPSNAQYVFVGVVAPGSGDAQSRTTVYWTENQVEIDVPTILALQQAEKPKGDFAHKYQVYTCTAASFNPGDPGDLTRSMNCSRPIPVTLTIDRARFTTARVFVGSDSDEEFEIQWTDEGQLYGLWSDHLPLSELPFTTATSAIVDVSEIPDGRYTINLNTCGISVGTSVASCRDEVEGDGISTLEVVIDREASWSERSWAEDFESNHAVYPMWRHHQQPTNGIATSLGIPISVTLSDDGSLAVLGEFSNSIYYVDSSGQPSSHLVPLREVEDSFGFLVQTTPFNYFWGPTGTMHKASLSTFAEHLIEVNGDYWFSQGGTGYYGTSEYDISRVVRFRPSATDLPSTVFDDRFCVVTIPSYGPQVIGLASDGSNLWYVESRPTGEKTDAFFTPSNSRLAHFPLADVPCDNNRDFSPLAQAHSATGNPPDEATFFADSPIQYCSEGGGGWCIERSIPIPNSELWPYVPFAEDFDSAIVSNMAIDPVDGSVWFVAHGGNFVGHYDPANDEMLRRYPLLPPKMPLAYEDIGAAPYHFAMDDNYLYIAELGDGDLVRMSKDDGSIEELPIPGGYPIVRETGSVALFDGKFWFTASDVFGYVDISAGSWTHAVLYTDAATLSDPDHLQTATTAVSGVSINDSGDVALIELLHQEVFVLTPVSP